MAHLVRLVLDDGWAAATAAARLRQLVPDPTMLRLLEARARRAHAERPSAIAGRAVETARRARGAAERAAPTPGHIRPEAVSSVSATPHTSRT